MHPVTVIVSFAPLSSFAFVRPDAGISMFSMSPHFTWSSKRRQTSVLASVKAHAMPAIDDNERERDNDILLALSLLSKIENTTRALHKNKADNNCSAKAIRVPSNTVFDGNICACVDVVQDATSAVKGGLAPCTSYDYRTQVLTRLRMHKKLDQVEKVLAHNADCIQHANVGAAALMQQAQKRGHIYPTNAQVHQLVFLEQQCGERDDKHELPETDDQNHRHPCSVQKEVSKPVEFSECVEGNGFQQLKIGDELELCSRMGEVAIHFDVADADEDESIRDRTTEEVAQRLSNQDEVDSINHYDVWNTSTHHHDTDIKELSELAKEAELSGASTPTPRLRVLPILTANMTVKGIRVPQLPRGRNGQYRSSDFDKANTSKPRSIHAKASGGSFRYKFRFSENEVLQLLDDEETNDDSILSSVMLETNQRLGTSSKTTVAAPLRRKSFSTRQDSSTSTGGFGASYVAGIATSELAQAPVLSSKTTPSNQLWTVRRKSTSTCHIIAPSSMSLSRRNSRIVSVTKQQIIAFNSKKKAAASSSKNLSDSLRSLPALSPLPTTQTQMVLRVRERTSDGTPALVIVKKPVHFVMWHWNDRCVRVPFMSAANYMELGPAQHGIMLRQLRYVKLMMYELPWAKVHLRALLSMYTAKEMSKEELYPQLNALGQQVQRDANFRARQHRALAARKQRLKVTLKLATCVVNETKVTKFGRRGRPHVSRLRYDPNFPRRLHWRRKHGEWSAEYLAVDDIQVIEVPNSPRLTSGAESVGHGNKKTVAALAVDPESCLSFVTPTRSLDLHVASPLHREWLANAVRDLVSCVQQQKVAVYGDPAHFARTRQL